MSELVSTQHLPRETLERISEAREVVKHGTASQLIDVLLYMDALVQVAREKRAAEVAEEAARTRIEAARRVGELILQSEDPTPIWENVPNRFMRCDELARIPKRLFTRSVDESLAAGSSATLPAIIRRAKISSFTRVEEGIFTDYTGSYWVKSSKGTQEIGYSLEEARRVLGLKKIKGGHRVDELYVQARRLSNAISGLKLTLFQYHQYAGTSVKDEALAIIDESELLQMKVAENLDALIRKLGEAT